jgi:hypothetical protein
MRGERDSMRAIRVLPLQHQVKISVISILFRNRSEYRTGRPVWRWHRTCLEGCVGAFFRTGLVKLRQVFALLSH